MKLSPYLKCNCSAKKTRTKQRQEVYSLQDRNILTAYVSEPRPDSRFYSNLLEKGIPPLFFSSILRVIEQFPLRESRVYAKICTLKRCMILDRRTHRTLPLHYSQKIVIIRIFRSKTALSFYCISMIKIKKFDL